MVKITARLPLPARLAFGVRRSAFGVRARARARARRVNGMPRMRSACAKPTARQALWDTWDQ